MKMIMKLYVCGKLIEEVSIGDAAHYKQREANVNIAEAWLKRRFKSILIPDGDWEIILVVKSKMNEGIIGK